MLKAVQGGLVSAALARIPGISEHHCGSAVVYRIETKAGWLGVSRKILEKPGPVSRNVAIEMAERVLNRTPEADVSASVTGHLGPEAPKRQDGLIYVAVAVRSSPHTKKRAKTIVKKHWLEAETAGNRSPSSSSLRLQRQLSAARFVLCTVRSLLQDSSAT